jgi:uncharacterized protein YbaR (Trm112 family)
MKPDLLEILRCPVCRAELKLRSDETAGAEVVKGMLTCTGCGETYPIEDGIPDLLPPGDRD